MTKTEPRSAGSGGGREKATPTELLALASALEGSQQQCDEDGTMIAVSRQAVHESLKALRTLATTLSAREDGWQLVPVEVTGPMLSQAAIALCAGGYANNFERSRAVWSAMLAAAPKAPTAGEGRHGS